MAIRKVGTQLSGNSRWESPLASCPLGPGTQPCLLPNQRSPQQSLKQSGDSCWVGSTKHVLAIRVTIGGELSQRCPLMDLCVAQASPSLVGEGPSKSSIPRGRRPVKNHLQKGHSAMSTAFCWSQKSQDPPKSRG